MYSQAKQIRFFVLLELFSATTNARSSSCSSVFVIGKDGIKQEFGYTDRGRSYFNRVLEFSDLSLIDKKRVLDIGSGQGALVKELRESIEYNIEAFGVDPHPPADPALKSYIHKGVAHSMPFLEPNYFDLTFSSYSLFAIDYQTTVGKPQIVDSLTEVLRVMRPSGHFVVYEPRTDLVEIINNYFGDRASITDYDPTQFLRIKKQVVLSR